MIQATLSRAHYLAQTEAAMQDEGGVRCTFSRVGSPASVIVQLDSVGCVTLTYKATPNADPKSILVSFMDELALCDQCALTDIDGTMRAE